MRPSRIRIAAVALIAAGVALVAVSPAFAHSDQGTMTAEVRPGADPTTVTARARVVFANDGHPASEATVTVTATGPGGAQAGPTTLNRVDEGEYEAALTLPAAGEWTLQFTAANPAASATVTATVQAPQTTTPPSTTDAGQRRVSGNYDDSSGLNASVFAIAGGAVVVAAVTGGVLIARRRR
jgi:YtkA-like